MLSRHMNKFLRHSYTRVISSHRSFVSAKSETDHIANPTERDPAPFFFNEEVQECLKTLTTVDFKKVFRIRKDNHKLKPPQYKFMTNKQLREAEEAAKRKAETYLQMPPVVKPRTDVSVPLCKDHALLNHNSAKYVFTDITFGLNDKDRFVVIRETDGTLRHATWQERDRIVPIYFPKPGRELVKSKMFEGEHLTSLLNRKEYEFILDRACVQFEPDDPNYQTITREVYEYVNLEKDFDILRSTRHFGPMVFHLVWTSNIDNLLCEMIETSRIKDAVLLIRLYYKIHPTTKATVDQSEKTDDIEFIMQYARMDSPKSGTIEKLLQSYKELQLEHQIVEEGIKKAHGISPEESVETERSVETEK
ncbi:28S ribosomal protein S22, mitochondrial [Pseudomyrmex gracilis]|uniref:28S ribosomal protein S22, mitochondrial n=1 Tax=Pseudomyrmex gracilis TaxID=219809 RepID=UPI00099547AE|nr:28S ribosomal protein S22, mitochondrial [Pseudomyrmex gracilis]